MSPSQKTGVDTPMTEKTRATWSARRLRRTAARIPRGMPTVRQRTRLARVSSRVAGKKSARSRVTGRWLRMDCPRSPCMRPVM